MLQKLIPWPSPIPIRFHFDIVFQGQVSNANEKLCRRKCFVTHTVFSILKDQYPCSLGIQSSLATFRLPLQISVAEFISQGHVASVNPASERAILSSSIAMVTSAIYFRDDVIFNNSESTPMVRS
jgi:hypothetical protein